MTPGEIRELLPSYALDAVEDHERVEIEGWLADHPSDQAIVDAHREDIADWAQELAEDPPAHLRGSLLTRVADTRQLQPDTAGPVASSAGNVVSMFRNRRPAVLALAAAAVILVVAVGIGLASRGGDDQNFDELASSSDAVAFSMTGANDSSMMVAYSPQAEKVGISATGVATLPTDEAYALWSLTADGAIPIGQFRPHDDGTVDAVLPLDDPGELVFAVTREPVGDLDQPSPPTLAVGRP